ncbi:hypothetical protein GCM10022258_13900 [Aquimarina gracilis]
MSMTSLLCLSQDSWDIITLKNGSVIVGKITEFNFNENLTVQTKDGYGYRFRMQDVQSVTKEKKQEQNRFNRVTPNNQNINQISSGNRSNYNQQSQVPNYQNATTFSSVPANVPLNNGSALSSQPQNNTNTYETLNSNQNLQRNYQGNPNNSFNNPSQFQNYQNTQSQTQYPQPITNQNTSNLRNNQYPNSNYNNQQNPNNQAVSGYYTNDPGNSRQQVFSTTATPITAPIQARKVPESDIFTNVNNYSNLKNVTPKVDCNQGFGNFGFVNRTNKNILVSIQKKQKDGYFADYKEISIGPNSKGYFNNIKANDYPFLVKTKKRLVGTNQSEYVILGKGSILIQKCRTEHLSIQ